jgi:hypothetical protein
VPVCSAMISDIDGTAKPCVVRRSVDATSWAAGVAFARTAEPGGRG